MLRATVSRSKIVDAYVILSLFLVPSSFLGLVSFRFFYIPGLFDLRLLSWMLSLPLLIIYWPKLTEINRTFSGKLLNIVVLFISFRFILSLTQGISFKEAFTVFRMGFNTPISSLAFLCFFYSIDNYRIERIFKWAFALFTLSMILYFLNYLELGLFDNIKDVNEESQGEITITRNLTGVPIYFPIFFVLSIYYALNSWRPLYLFIFLFSLFIIFISATRSFIITSSIILIIISLFFIVKLKTGYFKRVLILIVAISFFIVILFSLKSEVYQFIKIKFESTINIELKEDIGTYAYRKRLIDTSIEDNKLTGSMLLGKGYTREGNRESYKFVLGGDTLVAPVIFCEGFLGLSIRIVPILYFLLMAFRNLRSPGFTQFVSIGIIALIASSAVNYVQTTIFYNYIDYVLFFYIAQRYLDNYNYTMSEYYNTEIQ